MRSTKAAADESTSTADVPSLDSANPPAKQSSAAGPSSEVFPPGVNSNVEGQDDRAGRLANFGARGRRMSHDGVISSAANTAKQLAAVAHRSRTKANKQSGTELPSKSPAEFSSAIIFNKEVVSPSADRLARSSHSDEEEFKEVLTGDRIEPLQSTPFNHTAFHKGSLTGPIGLAISPSEPPSPRTRELSSADESYFQAAVSQEPQRDLTGCPLPVRLGLVVPEAVPASKYFTSEKDLNRTRVADEAFARADIFATSRLRFLGLGRPQYRDGYYLCTPPPAQESTTWRTEAGLSSLSAPIRARSLTRGMPRPKSSGSGSARPPPRSRQQSLSGRSSGPLFQSKSPTGCGSVVHAQDSSLNDPADPGYLRTVLSDSSSSSIGGLKTARDLASKAESFSEGGSKTARKSSEWQLANYFHRDSRRTPGRFGCVERRTHAYSPSEAPYFLSYGKNSRLAEVLTHSIVTKTGGLTRLPWENGPPLRVLDIGCGCGAWAVDLARQWPETEIVGLDLVPCQTPLDDEDDDIQRRISWVVANVLDGLPFANGSFDYVNIRFLNHAIPSHKWSAVLQDAVRVLKPNGFLEVLDGDWSFFGAPMAMLTDDYNALLAGQLTDTTSPIQTWEFERRGRAARRAQRFADLAKVCALPFDRVGISTTPTTVIPACLSAFTGAGAVGLGSTRRVPVPSRSRLALSLTSLEKGSSLSLEHRRRDNEEAPIKPDVDNFNAFVTQPNDVERPLQEHLFRVDDLDALRLAILGADIMRNSECKAMFWKELEIVRKAEAERRRFEKMGVFSPTSTMNGSGILNGSASLATPSSPPAPSPAAAPFFLSGSAARWADFGHFERDVDEWALELRSRTDVEILLRNTQRWDVAAKRIDGWTVDEQQRKDQRKRHMAAGARLKSTPVPPLPAELLSSSGIGEIADQENVAPTVPIHDVAPPLPPQPKAPSALVSPSQPSSVAATPSSSRSPPSTPPMLVRVPSLFGITDEDSKSSESDASHSTEEGEEGQEDGEAGTGWLERPHIIRASSRVGPTLLEDNAEVKQDIQSRDITSILGFRHICAWSFHKAPLATDSEATQPPMWSASAEALQRS